MSEEPKDGFGLDKAERLLAKRLGKQEEEAEQAAGLEPPFPYRPHSTSLPPSQP